jgi:amino acid permease
LSLSIGEDDAICLLPPTSTTTTTPTSTNKGNASVGQTAINVAKTCMGTGTLALPYAASQGGYICSSLGFILMASWNLYCVDRMIQCSDLLHTIERQQQQANLEQRLLRSNQSTSDDDEASIPTTNSRIPSGTSAFGKVVWNAIGPTGLTCYEFVMIILLLGIIVAYEG